MKKSILNIGKALNRIEQKQINGGGGSCPNDPYGTGHTGQSCNTTADCDPNPIPRAPIMCSFGCCLNAF